MKLVTVIPIARGVFRDSLTYWSGKEVSPGDIAAVSVRGKKTNALVVSTEDVGQTKAGIKSAPFSLKKIEAVKPNFFLPAFIRAASRLADYFCAPLGAVLAAYSPKTVLNDLPPGANPPAALPRPEKLPAARLKIEKFVFQDEDEKRLTAYRNLVREEFARKASVVMIFPTIGELETAQSAFGKGIEEYTFVFHGEIARKELIKRWREALKESHPVVILGTPAALGLPRGDVKTIIVERESSRAYKTIGRTGLDARVLAEFSAEERGARLIFGDHLLRAETLHRYHEHELLEFTSVKFRALSSATGVVIDMKKYRDRGRPAVILSSELKALIELNRREHGRLIILSGRRGINPATICRDCGTLVACGQCGAPLSLHEKNGRRFFLCHKCGKERRLERGREEHCRNCQSWRLEPLGVGVEGIVDELKKEFPGPNVSRVDGDSTKTAKAAKEVLSSFFRTRGGVLVATEMVLPYLTEPVESSAIVDIDSLFAIPDFRANEKIFSLVLTLRAKTKKTLIIQTQEGERMLLNQALRGDVLAFFREEISDRKKFGYPPFYALVKISWDSRRERVEKETAGLRERLTQYETRSYETPSPKGTLRAHILIKVLRHSWPDKKLLAVLKGLPPRYAVAVDPESIF